MTVAPAEAYEAAVRALFPRGAYWDEQLADPESDVSLFARAKAAEIVLFRGRMAALLAESRPESATETLGEWERVLLGAPDPSGDKEARRSALADAGSGNATVEAVRDAGRMFGFSVSEVSLPYRPAFFGHARFGADRLADAAGWAVVVVRASPADGPRRAEFEARLRALALANNILIFEYGG